MYAFRGRERFSPFALVGAGAGYDDVQPDEYDTTSAFANAALGVVTGDIASNGLRLRAEIRYFHDFFRDEFGDWQFGLGLSVPLGRTREVIVEREVVKEVRVEVPVPAAAPAVDPDPDHDGVPAPIDACPNTLPRARVDGRGCMVHEQTITLQDINSNTTPPRSLIKPGIRCEALHDRCSSSPTCESR